MVEKTKKCKKCGKNKPLKDFPKDNSAKDKKWRFCRSCESARKKEYRKRKLEKTQRQNGIIVTKDKR